MSSSVVLVWEMGVKVSSASAAAVGHVMSFLHKFQIYGEYENEKIRFQFRYNFPFVSIALRHIAV
jgi:hypothetical protein